MRSVITLVAVVSGAVLLTAAPALAAPAQTVPFVHSVVAGVGRDDYDMLGDGLGQTRSTFEDIPAFSSNVKQIAAGYNDTLALKTDGTLWGVGLNHYGELGDGTFTPRTTPEQLPITGVTQISNATGFAVALKSDGTVWAWGEDDQDQLGDSLSMNNPVPKPVPGLTGVTKVQAGYNFGLALKSDGTVWAWGDNAAGQLGIGQLGGVSDPVRISGITHAYDIATSWYNSLALVRTSLITNKTALLSWGSNVHGELGYATSGDSPTPQAVPNVSTFSIRQIATGAYLSAVLGTDGSVWVWGWNGYGQVGDGVKAVDRTAPGLTVNAGSGITQIAVGTDHVLAVTSSGTLEGWGSNDQGELGLGTVSNQVLTPTAIPSISSVTAAYAGNFFSLVLHNEISIHR
jgi:alpha-tubulin suppressor-like RCC1 family protein